MLTPGWRRCKCGRGGADPVYGLRMGCDARLEVEKLLAQGVFVFLLGLFCFVPRVFFAKAGGFPSVNFGLGVVVGCEGLFFADGGYPLVYSCFVSGLELVEIRDFNGHRSPR